MDEPSVWSFPLSPYLNSSTLQEAELEPQGWEGFTIKSRLHSWARPRPRPSLTVRATGSPTGPWTLVGRTFLSPWDQDQLSSRCSRPALSPNSEPKLILPHQSPILSILGPGPTRKPTGMLPHIPMPFTSNGSHSGEERCLKCGRKTLPRLCSHLTGVQVLLWLP